MNAQINRTTLIAKNWKWLKWSLTEEQGEYSNNTISVMNCWEGEEKESHMEYGVS